MPSENGKCLGKDPCGLNKQLESWQNSIKYSYNNDNNNAGVSV